MDLKDIKAIIDLMKKNTISEFEMERQDFKIKLKRGPDAGSQAGALDDPLQMTYIAGPGSANSAGPPVALPEADTDEMEIKSPMIGTFYASPSPESAAYVEVGTEVLPDTVVCIIEAMKVMNEIKAEVKGIVTEVRVENAKPVEFGQALFKIRSS